MRTAAVLLFAGLFVVSACGLAVATEEKAKAKPRETKLERLTKSLDLTSDQQKKIEVVLEDTKKKIKEVSTKSFEARKAVMEDENRKIKAALTPDQAKKYEAGRAEQSDSFKSWLRESKEPQEKRIEKLTNGLNLTPAQKENISAVLLETETKVSADKQQSFVTARNLARGEKKQIEAFLTPKQIKEYRADKKEAKKEYKEKKEEKIKEMQKKEQDKQEKQEKEKAPEK